MSKLLERCHNSPEVTGQVGGRAYSMRSEHLLRAHQKSEEVKLLSRVRLFVTPLTVAYQASLSMGFSRQEYQSGLPFPSPGELPDPGIEPGSLTL